jgi:phage gp36-like protein
MSKYTTIALVKDLGSMPAEDVDTLVGQYSGLVDRLIEYTSGEFDSYLAKRYQVPFGDPPDTPHSVVLNVSLVVCFRLWMKRGFNPSAQQDSFIKEQHDRALEWLKEAADAKDGFIELPRRQDTLGKSAVVLGAPLAYSEASPYTWIDNQRDTLSQGGR